MKFLFMTDTHGRTNSPISRKDDFPSAILKKMRWCVDKANDEGRMILHGGDWVNRPDTAPTFISMMASILGLCENGVVGILGNHDIYGYNTDSFRRTPMSIVNACNQIHILPNDESVLLEGDGVRVYISGVSSHALLDKNGRTEDYCTPRKDKPKAVDEIRIHIVHGFLTDHDWPESVPYTKIQDVLDTDADILLTGHEHTGYGIFTNNDTTFCNPGALGRVSAAVGDVNRSVQVADIDVFLENGCAKYNVSLVSLPDTIALPADEVLDRERLEAEKRTAQQIESFAEQIGEIEISEPILSPEQSTQQLQSILDRGTFGDIEITDSMRSIILDYVGKAEELENESRKRVGANEE